MAQSKLDGGEAKMHGLYLANNYGCGGKVLILALELISDKDPCGDVALNFDLPIVSKHTCIDMSEMNSSVRKAMAVGFSLTSRLVGCFKQIDS
jgi:hypothetical protein